MVEGMRADCLIVDSRPQNQDVTTSWACCLDPGIPLASQPDYISIHSLTLKCATYAFFLPPDDLCWVHDPICGVLSTVRSSTPKMLPTVHNI